MIRSTTFAFALALALAAPTLALRAQETRSDTLLTTEHYLDWERVTDVQISPDGSRIVYTRGFVNKLEDKWESALWILNADGSQHRFLVKGSVARWSPDGKSIAFSMFAADQEKWSISMPAEPKGAKWTPAPRVVGTLHYRQDQVGFLEDGFTHLFVVSAEGGTPRDLTPGKWSVGAGELRGGASIDWTPDSKSIVFDGNRMPDADLQYETSQLYVVDAGGGSVHELVTKAGEWGKPVVSPDGRTVAFTGHPTSTHTYAVSDLFVIPITGAAGDMRKISGDFDREPINLRWAPDGSGLYFDADDRGARNIHFASLVGGVKPITNGRHILTFDSMSKDLVAAGTSADPEHPQDVVRYSLRQPGQVAKLTDVNADVLQGKRLATVEEITYTSTGTAKVMGWLVKPPAFDASKKYPLILEIHGGPFASYNVAFNYMFQNFAANGFVVLYTNPRGSTGYGSEFINGIDHNYPGPDYDDLIAGVDAAIGKGFIDSSRLYVSGCSGGGVLSSWVIGHTDRFAAAAVRCPVTNWLSMAGQTDIPLFTYSFFKKPFWEDPSDWLAHSSLMSVGKVTTPTLLMTGTLDRRTPMPQTEEYYAALKVKGVPAKLLQFNEEYHGTGSKPSNYIRTQLYMMSWFNKYTRQAGGRVSTTSQP